MTAQTARAAAIVLALSALCAAQGDSVAVPDMRFADGDTLTVKASARVSVAIGRAEDKALGCPVIFHRSVAYVVRMLDAEAGRPVKSEVEFKSSIFRRECENFGPAAQKSLFEHGKTFLVLNPDSGDQVEHLPAGPAEPFEIPNPARRRVLAASLRNARAFLPAGPLAGNAEWEAEGPAVAALAAAGGIDGATGGKAAFRFAGPGKGDARLARVEIVSMTVEAGGADSGSTLLLTGSGFVVVDLDRGLVTRIECSGKTGLKDASGLSGKGDFSIEMTAGFLE